MSDINEIVGCHVIHRRTVSIEKMVPNKVKQNLQFDKGIIKRDYEIHLNRLVLNPWKFVHKPPTVYINLI